MSITDIIDILDETNAKRVLLLCHHNSDPDALCSAYVFQGLIKKVRPNISPEIGTGGGISKLSKQLLRYVTIDVNLIPTVENADAIVLLDTNTILQLGELADEVKKATVPLLVIDHHAVHPETERLAKLIIAKEDSSSTCEIVYSFYKELHQKLELNEAKALFLGIAFDTRHFVLANSSTFKTIAELGEIGVNAQETLAILSLPMDFSERVARIKACRRAKLLKVDDWIIALSHVGAYQASAARALVDLGAHVAVVAGQRNGNVEISMRSSRDFNKQTSIHLGKDIAKPLGESLMGMGGGHSTAAGVNGVGDVKTGLKRCLRLIKEKLANH